jgi:hypothetical protein
MSSQAISVERRQHPREGILGELENITYGVLRKHGIASEATGEAAMSENETRRVLRRKEDTTMTANLVVIVSNERPNREESYPRTWLLYIQGQDAVEVHVAHDSNHRPHVLGKGAA